MLRWTDENGTPRGPNYTEFMAVPKGRILAWAKAITRDLVVNQGLVLTLRQLYYQMVAHTPGEVGIPEGPLAPSGQKVYRRIGTILADARATGSFPLDWIEDRTRTVGTTYSWIRTDAEYAVKGIINEIIEGSHRWLGKARWHGQSDVAFVICEKEALAGVFQRPCDNAGVGLFCAKGYPSLSSIYQLLKQLAEFEVADHLDHVTFQLLYFGDHDPDGVEIPEAIMNRIRELMHGTDEYGEPFFEDGTWDNRSIELTWVGLTQEQITEGGYVPFEAKRTSPRFKKYMARYGVSEAWELDAMHPATLAKLIESSIEAFFDWDESRIGNAEVREARVELRELLPDALTALLESDRI